MMDEISKHIGGRNKGATTVLQLWGNQKQVKKGAGGGEGSTPGAKVTVPTVTVVAPASPVASLRESRRVRTAGGVAAGRGSADGGWAPGAGTAGDARWDAPMARGSWVDQMSEMSLSGRDSIPQDGGRNARVRRAVRISSLVAQEVRWCARTCVCVCRNMKYVTKTRRAIRKYMCRAFKTCSWFPFICALSRRTFDLWPDPLQPLSGRSRKPRSGNQDVH